MTQTEVLIMAVVLGILTFAVPLFLIWFIEDHTRIDNLFVQGGIPAITGVVLGICTFASLLWAFDDNFYGVKSGVVIDESFTAAHCVKVCSPDDWALEIRSDDGKTGWLHFRENVFETYPRGSQYPH